MPPADPACIVSSFDHTARSCRLPAATGRRATGGARPHQRVLELGGRSPVGCLFVGHSEAAGGTEGS